MGSSGGMMMGGGDMMAMMSMMGAGSSAGHIEGRLAFVKTELNIADSQTSQWDAFAEAVRANFKSMTDMRQSMMSRQKRPNRSRSDLPWRIRLRRRISRA